METAFHGKSRAGPSEQDVRATCSAWGNRADALIEILHAVQARFGFVPRDADPTIADALNISRADVHGVITFYHDFRRAEPGRHIVRVCRAEACQAMRSESLAAHACDRLGCNFGGTTGDRRVTLEPVYCLGNCALSPAVMIDDRLHGRVDPARFDALMDELGGEAAE